MSEVNPKITKEFRNIEVNFTNLDELDEASIVIVEPEEVKVNVKVAGRRSDIIKLTEDDIIAKTDLSGYTEGNKKVPIDVSIDSNKVELVDYEPKVVVFKFESMTTKEIPIQVKTTGKLDSGYVMGDYKIKPKNVVIKGPRSQVNSISEALAIVDISGETGDINLTAPIKLIDQNGNEVKGIEKKPKSINIYIPVYRVKSVPIELQTTGSLPAEYKTTNISVVPRTIEIKGKGDIVEKVNAIKTLPVDLNRLIQNKSVPVELEIPEGVELVNPNKKVFVTLDTLDGDTSTETEQSHQEEFVTKNLDYSFNEIRVNNLEPELIIGNKDSISNISITIQGNENRIAEIAKNDFNPEIDLTGLTEGAHDVEINVKDVSGIEVIDIKPPNLKIILEKQ